MNKEELKQNLSLLLNDVGSGVSRMEAIMTKMKPLVESIYPTVKEFEADRKWIIGEIKKGLCLTDRSIIKVYEEAKEHKATLFKVGRNFIIGLFTSIQ